MPKSTDKLAHQIRNQYEEKGYSHNESERIGHSTVNKMRSKGQI